MASISKRRKAFANKVDRVKAYAALDAQLGFVMHKMEDD